MMVNALQYLEMPIYVWQYGHSFLIWVKLAHALSGVILKRLFKNILYLPA